MSDFGYCRAFRGAWSHPVFKDLREASIWNFLYQNAFWRDGVRNFNGQLFELKRGQIVISISFLAKGFCMTEKGVRVVIQKLEKQGMLVKQGASKGTIITICNYSKYQDFEKTEGEQEGKQGANKGRTKGENKKEVKKDKEVNTITIPSFIDGDVWMDWYEYRKEKKKKLTKTTIEKQIKKLTKWHNEGHDVNEIINTSIMNTWIGLFKPKEGAQSAKHSKSEKADRELQEFLDRPRG